MAGEWYYARNGQQVGPLTFEQLRQLAGNGQLQKQDLVWSEGMTNWVTAETIEGLFPVPFSSTATSGAQWFYARGSEQVGPFELSQLQQMAQSGQLQQTDLVWTEGMEQWSPAQTVPQLFTPQTMPDIPMARPTPLAYHASSLPGGSPPPNYLVQSILVTLCCCLWFGIPAIVYAAQVNSKYQYGDFQGAIAASENAKKWCWIAFIVGLITNAIGIVIQAAIAH